MKLQLVDFTLYFHTSNLEWHESLKTAFLEHQNFDDDKPKRIKIGHTKTFLDELKRNIPQWIIMLVSWKW